jgi:aminomethyltransferase
MKRTPLFSAHVKLGGRLVEFGGWEMPVQYTGIIDEHQAVRQAAGLFDISHMGQVLVGGPKAEGFLNQVLTNNVRKLSPGQGQYTLLCNERGGTQDDLYLYRLAGEEYLLIVNASRTESDVGWLQQQLTALGARDGVRLQNASDLFGAVAVQGPAVVRFIDRCFAGPSTAGTPVAQVSALSKNQIAKFSFRNGEAWISRTGYTGEDGFEVMAHSELVAPIWSLIMAEGAAHGIKPAGLGARDTLRTEVCYPLYGHELDEVTSPLEAGLGFFVALDKGEFVGRAALARQKAEGTARKLVAFKMTDKSAPPRPHYPICGPGAGTAPIGQVASGTLSPSLGIGIGMGFVPLQYSKSQTALDIEIRGKRAAAVVVPKPIYRKTA